MRLKFPNIQPKSVPNTLHMKDWAFSVIEIFIYYFKVGNVHLIVLIGSNINSGSAVAQW